MIFVEPASWEPACAGNPLENGALEIWRTPAGLSTATDKAAPLKPEEQAHAELMLNPMRRAQFAAGHALLNKIRARHGAPLFTSLSHSGQWVLAAAAKSGPVGVDAEILRADRPLCRLSQRFFAPEEHAWLAQFPEEERVHLFYGLWTAKEALFKALGMPSGAAHFAARRVFAPEGSQALPESCIVEGCRVGWFSAAPGCMGAYAAPVGVSRVRYLRPG